MRRLRVLVSILVLVLGAGLGWPGEALAVADPDSISVGSVAVFRNLKEEGDQLFFVRYDVSYAAEPSQVASETFQMAIYDTDLIFTGFSRPLNYYQHNIISIYLTADEALTWGTEYRVRIMGNPGIFSPLQEGVNMKTQALSGGDYYEIDDLGGYIIAQAQILEDDWAITLLTAGDLLNTTGSTYFTKAIPGLNTIVPEIFQFTSYYPTYNATNWTTSGEDSMLEHRGPVLNAALEDLANWVGSSSSWMGVFLTVMMASMLGGTAYASLRTPSLALLLASLALPLAVWIGLISITLWMLVFLMVAILFGILFIQSRFG